MTWKRIALAVCLATILAPMPGESQEPARGGPRRPPGQAAKESSPRAKELAALEASAKVFAEAFNRGDAKAVAALWTKDGEYIDGSGEQYEGRDAIEKEYATFFAAHPRAKIQLLIDSLRLIGPDAAIEDGRAVVEVGPDGAAGSAKYTTVHSKVDGKWLMASVRDLAVESPSTAGQLHDLAWLVGTWRAEENGANMEVVCRWIAGTSFLERSYSVKRSEQVVSAGVQIVGWNPQAESIQSWNFTSDGGHAVGVWTPRKSGWAIEATGMLADGATTSAVNLFSKIDDNTCSWQSVRRAAGGTPLPDTAEVLLKRVAASQ